MAHRLDSASMTNSSHMSPHPIPSSVDHRCGVPDALVPAISSHHPHVPHVAVPVGRCRCWHVPAKVGTPLGFVGRAVASVVSPGASHHRFEGPEELILIGFSVEVCVDFPHEIGGLPLIDPLGDSPLCKEFIKEHGNLIGLEYPIPVGVIPFHNLVNVELELVVRGAWLISHAIGDSLTEHFNN